MKKLSFLMIIVVIFGVVSLKKNTASANENYYSASGMIVVEQNTRKVLLSSSCDSRMPMASITKVVTAIVAIENTDDLDEKRIIPKEAVGIEGSSIYLVEGEELSIRELLYGLMLQSGNDAAEAIAILVGGTCEKFVTKMNDLVVKLNLTDTHFSNPSGLHNDEHYTSAYDFAMLSCYAMDSEVFREIVSTKKITISNTKRDYPRVLLNKNKMLSMFEGASGIKTGYTKKSGRCLVSSSTRGNMSLVCVVLNCPNMWHDSMNAMDYCFENYENIELIRSGLIENTVQVEHGEKSILRLAINKSYVVTQKKGKPSEYDVIYDLPDILIAPIKAGTQIGKIKVFCQDNLVYSDDIYAVDSIERKAIFGGHHTLDTIINNWVVL